MSHVLRTRRGQSTHSTAGSSFSRRSHFGRSLSLLPARKLLIANGSVLGVERKIGEKWYKGFTVNRRWKASFGSCAETRHTNVLGKHRPRLHTRRGPLTKCLGVPPKVVRHVYINKYVPCLTCHSPRRYYTSVSWC